MKDGTPASGCALGRGDVRGSGELSTGEVYSAAATIRGALVDLRGAVLDLRAARWQLRRVALLRGLAATCTGADLETVNEALARVEREA